MVSLLLSEGLRQIIFDTFPKPKIYPQWRNS